MVVRPQDSICLKLLWTYGLQFLVVFCLQLLGVTLTTVSKSNQHQIDFGFVKMQPRPH